MRRSNDEQANSQTQIKLAVFDIDETFVQGDSFKRFCWFALRTEGIRFSRTCGLLAATLRCLTSRLDAGSIKGVWLRVLLRQHNKEWLKVITNDFVDGVLRAKVYSAAIDRLLWHKQQNHTLVFLSASPDIYLTELQSRFGVDRLICTKFLSDDGEFTGELNTANCKGEEKRRRLLDEYPTSTVDWDQSYGYGNSVDDIPFLEILGHAVAVNPDPGLRKIATQRSWPIEIWK